jgi:hypothetical protein
MHTTIAISPLSRAICCQLHNAHAHHVLELPRTRGLALVVIHCTCLPVSFESEVLCPLLSGGRVGLYL